MNARETINIIREAAEYAKNHGLEIVRINDLGKLLNDIEKVIISKETQISATPPAEIALAQFKALHESSLVQYKELFRSTIQAGQAALKSAILINGGGAFALLAFIGHIWNAHPSGGIVYGLSCSLLGFAVGVLAAAAASGTTYLAQFSWGGGWKKTGTLINIISILLVLASLILFTFGCYTAFKVFITHFKPS